MRSMTGRTEDSSGTSPRVYARIVGAGYLVIIVAGIFAEFFVRSGLIVKGDAAATAANITASESLFRIGIAADLVMLTCDVVVAWAIYMLFREVNKGLTLLATFFRMAHAAVYGVTLLALYVPLLILGGADYLNPFGTGQLHALVLVLLGAHSYGYVIGLVFFGFHCAVLGYLVFRSGYVPRVLGVLLALAATGYLIDSFARTLMTNYFHYEAVFTAVVFTPAFVGELAFCLWLLIRGVNVNPARPPVSGEPPE